MKHGIINRYLMREITGIFFLGLTIFTLVLLMGRMVKLMEMVVANGVPLAEVLRLIILLLPSFLVLTIPMAFLLAVLLAFGRLSSDNEITVLKASGLSLGALLPPVLLTATAAALLTLFISAWGVPWGNTGFKQMTMDVARKYAASAIRERIFRDDLPGIVLYVDQYDEAQRTMQRVMIQDSRDQERPLTIFAKSGLISSDDGTGVLRILLKNGTIHTQQKEDYRLISFGEYLLTAESGRSTPLVRTEMDLGIGELRNGIGSLKVSPQARLKMATELHSRFAFPFATFVFAILALPLGLSNRRTGKGSGFTISILILLVYYVLLSFLRTLAEKGGISPVLAVWLPNLIFLSIGLFLLRLASQEMTIRSALGRLFRFGRTA
ncbi:lipopolysaccharide export system permease protein [Trichlorobacter thiogenes]|uniref:Lipopolysaccharide export system permease protein n=1 Tax=Trichlorobacter thiogenes TaxID=115783 RepID=A0A1T4L9E7_9BACT|nr:LPS export ABC transporter permease LptF [Trichlorobacter thiogenes]SJZ51220.1 lipopolysaccharide export system permease protein [Trichlorobacter thiogenes]